MNANAFTLIGAGHGPAAVAPPPPQKTWLRGKPVLSMLVLALVVLGCVFSEFMVNYNPAELHLLHTTEAPGPDFWFGTDTLGRDIYSIIWHGGRASLTIGLLSMVVITVLGVTYGCASGLASSVVDNAMMRAVELMQSVPVLLSLLLILSLTGKQSVFSLSLAIGVTGWFGLARIVRSEVRQIRHSEYILAARCFGASFSHIMCWHLIPNFVSAIMFVVISSISTSMAMEATLSFLGLGLPVEQLSWGSMLAFADRALLLNAWWIIVIPGLFLVGTLFSITSIGHYFRKQVNRGSSNL